MVLIHPIFHQANKTIYKTININLDKYNINYNILIYKKNLRSLL